MSITNYDYTATGYKILNNMMTVSTMSFALCPRRVSSVVSAQDHTLPSSVYKLDQYLVELHDLNRE
ncbi:hypothetical protein BHE74_00034639 [Ensete ventricosum]|nr:hypothetical protein BHE74_00034639 [Ensete ventricosum]